MKNIFELKDRLPHVPVKNVPWKIMKSDYQLIQNFVKKPFNAVLNSSFNSKNKGLRKYYIT